MAEVLPDFAQYGGPPIDFGRMEATASDPSVQQQFGSIAAMPNAGVLALSCHRVLRPLTGQGRRRAYPHDPRVPEQLELAAPKSFAPECQAHGRRSHACKRPRFPL